jgi:hypothetical protein
MNWSMAQFETKKNKLYEIKGTSGEFGTGEYSTRGFSIRSGSSSTSSNFEVSPSPSPGPPPVSKKKLALAILAHIKAIRALGRTEINTQEVADALCISVQEVNDALEVLKKQGVRRR